MWTELTPKASPGKREATQLPIVRPRPYTRGKRGEILKNSRNCSVEQAPDSAVGSCVGEYAG